MGPLYYLTLGELSEVLAPATAKPVLDKLGGKPFLVQLQNILPIRNAVGHGRSVSESGFVSLKAVYQQLVTALGEDKMLRLVSRPDLGLRPEDAARTLLLWLEDSLGFVERLDFPCPSNPALEEARRQHWWDRDDVAFDCKLVGRAADAISNYNRLPAGLGSRELRRQFALEVSLALTIANAVNALRRVCS